MLNYDPHSVKSAYAIKLERTFGQFNPSTFTFDNGIGMRLVHGIESANHNRRMTRRTIAMLGRKFPIPDQERLLLSIMRNPKVNVEEFDAAKNTAITRLTHPCLFGTSLPSESWIALRVE